MPYKIIRQCLNEGKNLKRGRGRMFHKNWCLACSGELYTGSHVPQYSEMPLSLTYKNHLDSHLGTILMAPWRIFNTRIQLYAHKIWNAQHDKLEQSSRPSKTHFQTAEKCKCVLDRNIINNQLWVFMFLLEAAFLVLTKNEQNRPRDYKTDFHIVPNLQENDMVWPLRLIR